MKQTTKKQKHIVERFTVILRVDDDGIVNIFNVPEKLISLINKRQNIDIKTYETKSYFFKTITLKDVDLYSNMILKRVSK